jgi:hypothetical protein
MPHPHIRRLSWHPLLPAIGIIWLAWRCWQFGFTAWRTTGLILVAVWLGLAIYDRFTRHRFLDWLYDGQ